LTEFVRIFYEIFFGFGLFSGIFGVFLG